MRAAAILAILAAMPVGAYAQSPTPALVLRVDNVTLADTPKHRLIITVKGAVRSGGWSKPDLRAGKRDGDTLVFDLVAMPPPKNATFIEAVMPVQASETIAMPPQSVTQIKIVSETNSATAPINR
ncbi:MAG TPA: hypothetical protein VIJ62_05485 [Rhizomicrobium sp.]